MDKIKLYQFLTVANEARKNCIKTNNPYADNWQDKIDRACQLLPSGSGIDRACQFDQENSNDNKLIITSSFHVMDENGYYNGWIDFTVILKPSLQFGYIVDIIGKFGKNQDLKEYLADTFNYCLDQEVIL